MRGYNIKYALTSGIREVEVHDDGKYVYTTDRYPMQLRVGETFFQDRGEAEAHAQQLARKKIASLKRQIAKLEKLVQQWSSTDE